MALTVRKKLGDEKRMEALPFIFFMLAAHMLHIRKMLTKKKGG